MLLEVHHHVIGMKSSSLSVPDFHFCMILVVSDDVAAARNNDNNLMVDDDDFVVVVFVAQADNKKVATITNSIFLIEYLKTIFELP